jgi:glyoxylase-like metal-dependent hydrolase (beta-lactamase superfamily II)
MPAAPGHRTRPARTPPPPRDLGGGLWRVAVPIPHNPLGYTLVYALDTDRGPVLIDAGWDHQDGWSALRDGLARLGISVTEVYGVVVTHHHPDHAGLAGRVREASGAWIAMHGADVAIVRRFAALEPADHEEWRARTLRQAGADEAEVAAFAAREQREYMPAAPAVPDRELDDGRLADLPGRRLRVVWTPGHTPGHVCLHLDESPPQRPGRTGHHGAGRLFTGDHVLPGITPHIGLYQYDQPGDRPGTDPLGDFLDSLERVAALPVAEALPAHEHGFAELGARAAAIGEHHADRLAEVRGLLSQAPVTLWEVAAGMHWKHSWAGLHPGMRRMALAEAAAHLRRLETDGLVRRADRDGVIRFVAADPRGHVES